MKYNKLPVIFNNMIDSMGIGINYSDQVKNIELLKKDKIRLLRISSDIDNQLNKTLEVIEMLVENSNEISQELIDGMDNLIKEQVKLTDMLLKTL